MPLRFRLSALCWISLCLVPLFAVELSAQPPAAAGQMRRQLQTRFEATSPDVGESLPDVSLFDADGKPFHLRNLKGDYTVLVFGCLT